MHHGRRQELRAQIDNETYKGLLAINGGGIIALLSFLAASFDKAPKGLKQALLWAVLLMIFGLASAVLHNHLRRRCSLVFEHNLGHPPPDALFGIGLGQPRVCFFSTACMLASLVLFLVAGLTVAIAGLVTFQ